MYYSKLSSNIHVHTGPRMLARFLIPEIITFLLTVSQVRLDTCWLPSICKCWFLYLHDYLAIMIIIVVNECCSWVGLFDCFPPLATCIAFSRTMKTRPKDFWIGSSLNYLSPLSQSLTSNPDM